MFGSRLYPHPPRNAALRILGAPPSPRKVPEHRTDVGVFLLGEVLGAKSVIFVKDEDGLYTNDPKKNSQAEFIAKISAQELMQLDLQDLVIERKVVQLLQVARHIKQIHIINGLQPGNLTKALEGEHVGTLIVARDAQP